MNGSNYFEKFDEPGAAPAPPQARGGNYFEKYGPAVPSGAPARPPAQAAAPPPARLDDLYAEEKQPRDPRNPNMAWVDIPGVGRAAKGAAKTVIGLGAGAAEAFGAGQHPLARIAGQWAKSPASSIAEEEGRFLPYLVQPRLGLQALPARTVWGGLIGGFTPTESGTPESHEENAKWGAGMSAALGTLGLPANAIRASPTLRYALGHAINAAIGETISKTLGYGHYGLMYGLFHHGPGYAIAKRLPELMQTITKTPGGVTGKAVATQRDSNAQ